VTSFDVRRAADRAITRTDWLHSAHSFSFGSHYDPDNVSFGPLLACNVDEVRPGEGYARHRHAAVEILTWVLAGALEHVDVTGNRRVEPGVLQHLSAGTGLEHAERSAARQRPVRVVQMWLAGPAATGPRYETADLSAPLAGGRLVLAASGDRPAPIALGRPGAELLVGRVPAGGLVELPAARYVHVLLTSGAVAVPAAGAGLGPEDALRITGCPGLPLTARADAELLVWAMA